MFEPIESGIRVSVVAHAMLGYHIRISRVWIKLVAVDGSIYHGLRLFKDVQMFVYANGLHDELGRTQTPRDQCGAPVASRGLERHEVVWRRERDHFVTQKLHI